MTLKGVRMKEELNSFIKKLKEDKNIYKYNEAQTKQGIILPLLEILGWDIFNTEEIVPELEINGGKVDYSLRINNNNTVFIEVKSTQENLEDFQQQLLNYSFKGGIRLAILTNGKTWWFYLPLKEVGWQQRKFYTIDIFEQDLEDVCQKFIDFLSKDNIAKGEAIKKAEEIYETKKKEDILKETIPRAWNKLIEEKNSELIDLINKTTENLCGYTAPKNLIIEFLSNLKESELPPVSPVITSPKQKSQDFTGKKVKAFNFLNQTYEVSSWKEVLIKLCEILYKKHHNEFRKVLNLKGRNRKYFSFNKKDLFRPQLIPSSNIYIETNFSANNIAKICFDLLSLFKYPNDVLKITTS